MNKDDFKAHLYDAAADFFDVGCEAEVVGLVDNWVERVAAMPLEEKQSSRAEELREVLDLRYGGKAKAFTKWSFKSPGVIRLDGTTFTVRHDANGQMPWVLEGTDKTIGTRFESLADAKAYAENYAAELREVGLLD